ncbi:unnamed protein product [Cuscuta campestris]|uniref:Uncharacterized protein n=1 Tax=Cuscuta campestris TaxID=132261 RepID=A0A484NRV0_9ASTE|nr:unnamed protein product [Cuscuta campestris]
MHRDGWKRRTRVLTLAHEIIKLGQQLQTLEQHRGTDSATRVKDFTQIHQRRHRFKCTDFRWKYVSHSLYTS